MGLYAFEWVQSRIPSISDAYIRSRRPAPFVGASAICAVARTDGDVLDYSKINIRAQTSSRERALNKNSMRIQ